MKQQLSLFDLEQFTQSPVPNPHYDPAWDYDDTQDPPDPDDYPTLEDYEIAWNEWEKRYPELVSQTQGMTVLEQETTDTQQTSNHDSDVLEQETTDTNQSAPEQSHWVEKYKVVRYNKEHYYYRYLWMSGRKLHHVHIGGGNVRSSMAIQRKQMVENAIAAGKSPREIEKMIHSWRNHRS